MDEIFTSAATTISADVKSVAAIAVPIMVAVMGVKIAKKVFKQVGNG